MVHQKAAPKRKTPMTTTTYGHHAAYKKAMTTANHRTGGRLGVGNRTGGFSGIEHKFLDSNFIGQVDNLLANAIHENITQLCLNGIPPGTGEDERIGRRVRLTDLEINGHYELITETIASEAGSMFTIWIVKDTQTNRIQMNPLEYLKGGAPTSQATNTMYNLQWKDRFETLYKRTFRVQATTYNTNSNQFGSAYVPFQIKIPLNCPVLFNNQTGSVDGTVSSISDNSIHFLCVSDKANTGGNANVFYQSRVRFVDM